MTAWPETSETRLAHRVRLVHATSGEPITPARVADAEWPRDWWARLAGPDLVVGVRLDAPDDPAVPPGTVPPTPTSPVLHVDLVLDHAQAALLALPAAVAGQPPDSVRVALDTDDRTLALPRCRCG